MEIEYVRMPPEMVRISKYPEPEEFVWEEMEIKIQQAVQEFYEDKNGVCIE